MADRTARPDPEQELLVLALGTIAGPSYWSRRPVAVMELAVGAYEDISSAHVPGLTESLLEALPPLREHRCSRGYPGGFVERLEEGTYAPHIIEHVAIALQESAGMDVAFGRARGAGREAHYVVVVEHEKPVAGVRALALATELVQCALAGLPLRVPHALAELGAIAGDAEACALVPQASAVVVGPLARVQFVHELHGRSTRGPVLSVSPVSLLHGGLPVRSTDLVVILDADPRDCLPHYREDDRAARLLGVPCDALPRNGIVVAPDGAPMLDEVIATAGCRRIPLPADDAERIALVRTLLADGESGPERRSHVA